MCNYLISESYGEYTSISVNITIAIKVLMHNMKCFTHFDASKITWRHGRFARLHVNQFQLLTTNAPS